MSDLPTLVPLLAGRLAVWHRPGRRHLPALAALGVTHVVTLLTAREGAEALGAQVRAAGLAWEWAPMEGGAPERTADETAALRATLLRLAARLREAPPAVVLVHCSAGIHRTGMVAHALLRLAGLEPPAAREALGRLRAVTAEGVGEPRLAWGDGLVGPG